MSNANSAYFQLALFLMLVITLPLTFASPHCVYSGISTPTIDSDSDSNTSPTVSSTQTSYRINRTSKALEAMNTAWSVSSTTDKTSEVWSWTTLSATIADSTPAAISQTTSTTSTTTTSSSGSTTTGNPRPDCSCGYLLNDYNSAYFTSRTLVDFSTMSDLSGLTDATFDISDGYQVGAVSTKDGMTSCKASSNNVGLSDGVLTLTVPKDQTANGVLSLSCAQIQFPKVTYGVFTMLALPSSVHGTARNMFTYHGTTQAVGDEQDIEMMGATLTGSRTNYAEGVQLTNWEPSDTTHSVKQTIIAPWPSDPTAGYNNYTIAWLSSATTYHFNAHQLTGPSQYPSVNPSNLIINNWSNGDDAFSSGPPTGQDNVMKIKALYFYTGGDGSQSRLPSGCSISNACQA